MIIIPFCTRSLFRDPVFIGVSWIITNNGELLRVR